MKSVIQQNMLKEQSGCTVLPWVCSDRLQLKSMCKIFRCFFNILFPFLKLSEDVLFLFLFFKWLLEIEEDTTFQLNMSHLFKSLLILTLNYKIPLNFNIHI